MSDVRARTDDDEAADHPGAEGLRIVELPGKGARSKRRYGGPLLGGGVLLLLAGGLGIGGWRHYEAAREVAAVAEQVRTNVPEVRVATVQASGDLMKVTLPATTTAFEAANIFARTSGYIEKRYVDIGDRVKKGDLLVEITAPELDQQIAQAQATLAQDQAALQQAQASRELADVTNSRDSNLVKQGWLTAQQGDNDRLTLRAQQGAVGVAQSNIAAQEAQIRVLQQEKSYQRVVAPFDGVVTQRNVDNGSLVQAGSTFMFTMMHSNVIRTQVFVPQDEAFGVAPGVDADIRVPEIPGRTFAGKVTRIATALQPGSRTLLTEIDVPNHRWPAQSRHLLHGRIIDPAQDALDDDPVRCACLRSERPPCRGRAEWYGSFSAGLDLQGFRHHGGSARRRAARRSGRAQSCGQSGGGQQGHGSQERSELGHKR
ncbi:efflux RND transporter periplasmic adaptor subunit [Bradyrhizobium diazoefficiens]